MSNSINKQTTKIEGNNKKQKKKGDRTTIIDIIKWAESVLNTILTEKKKEVYKDYISWLESLAKKNEYELHLKV
jgi:hypothetical protein